MDAPAPGLAARRKNKRAVRAHHDDLALSMSSLNLASPLYSPQVRAASPAFAPPFAGPAPGSPFTPGTPFAAPPGSPFAAPGPFAGSPGSPFGAPGPVGAPGGAPGGAPVPAAPLIAASRYAQQLEFTPTAASNPAFLTFQNVVPPAAGTDMVCVDQGTALPHFIRASMYNVPESEHLRQATKLPVLVTVRPFPGGPEDDDVPVVAYGAAAAAAAVTGAYTGADADAAAGAAWPPRCRRCRAYMNPLMQHHVAGTFTCNICQFDNNECPSDYAAAVDPVLGRRVDAAVRPELHRGVYDFVVPQHYNVDPSQPNEVFHHVFLVDVSESSRRQGLPVLVADAVRAVLYGGEAPFVGRIALIMYDQKVTFFNLGSALEAPQLQVLTDLEDPFVPFADGLFADPEESRGVIEDALGYLESLGGVGDPEPCFGAAVRAATMCLAHAARGGKITAVLAALPSWGPGGLRFKENRAVGRAPLAEAERAHANPDSPYYHQLARDCLALAVSVECLVCSDASVDLLNVGWLCLVTGGAVRKWARFEFERDGRAVAAHFAASVEGVRGYQGQLKVRCLNGLQVEQYYGALTAAAALRAVLAVGGAAEDPTVAAVHTAQLFLVLFRYDGTLDTKYDCHFQAALLYTDRRGVRKVRVVNLVLAVSERLEDVFNFVEQDAVVATIVRDTLLFVGRQPFAELRELVNTKLVEVFAQYRAMSEVGLRAAPRQLLFPDSLKHLPMYMLAFVKLAALRQGVETDARLAEVLAMAREPVARLMYRLYPVMVAAHDLVEAAEGGGDDNGDATLGAVAAAAARGRPLRSPVDPSVYLICNGAEVFIWIHTDNVRLLQDLFGLHVSSASDIDATMDELPELPTHVLAQARAVVRHWQSAVCGLPSVGSAGVRIVRDFELVEDATHGPSYADFLANLHRAIRVKLDNDKLNTRLALLARFIS